MKRSLPFALVILMLTAILLGMGQRTQKQNEGQEMKTADTAQRLPEAANALGFDLFSKLATKRPKENLFLSPYSIHAALCMAYHGARGQTARAMSAVMHIGHWQMSQLMDDCLGLKKELSSEDEKISLEIANSLWSRQGLKLRSDFQQAVKKYFDGQARELDFKDPQAVGIINGWVRERTRGKIEKIIEFIPPDAALYLINAVYFKGRWQRQFDKALTRDREFYPLEGGPQKMPFMNQEGEYQYLKGQDFQAVRLPYGTGRFGMFVFLPDRKDGLEGFLARVDPKNWAEWLAQFERTRGRVSLPRFKADFFQDLVPALEELGMGPAFRATADFSGMSDEGLAISEVLHKAMVEVNEEGTVAAAVTSIGVKVTSVQPVQKPFEMVVDHPFFIAIVDQDTEAILFMGAIYQPKL